jgi:hypothetical protein
MEKNQETDIQNNYPDNKVIINNEREFVEIEGGVYIEEGFYVTPNGSFWDPDGVYFNREGYDKHEGFYDEGFEYNPGRGWIPHLMCYEDDLPDKVKDDVDVEGEDDGLDYDNLDDLHEEVDYDKILDNKDKEECIIKKKPLVFTGDKKPVPRVEKNKEDFEGNVDSNLNENSTTTTKVDVDDFFETK